MKKIYIVVNVDWFFLSHRKDIALEAQRKGYNVTIVTADTGKRFEIEQLGLNYINLPMERSNQNILKEIKTFIFLYNLYKKNKPDIIHHVGLKTILWGTMASKLTKSKGVVNAISGLGTTFSIERRVLTKFIVKFLRYSHNQKNLYAIFQNNEDKTIFIENNIISEDQAFLIKGSGVDLKEFCYTPEPSNKKITILFTARMIVEKGVYILIEAANILKKNYRNNIQFILCGGIDDNPHAIKRNELEKICDGEYIQWVGYRTDILDLLKSSHIVAFPSFYKEGLPKSLIEATAVGRPIVTTNSIGCKDTVIDGYNGFLIPIKDSLSLAKKIELLVNDQQLRLSMGKNSRTLAEKNFSIQDVINKHMEIYNSISSK